MKLQDLLNTREVKFRRHELHGILCASNAGKRVTVLIDEETKVSVLAVSKNWYCQNNGYVYTFVNKRKIYLHRLLTSATEGLDVDHINHDTLDNRMSNLRVVGRDVNSHNSPNTWARSGFLGVSWHTTNSCWRARLNKDGNVVYQSLHKDKISAARAYDAAATVFYGPEAMTNAKLGLLAAEPEEVANSHAELPNGTQGIARLQRQ